MACKEPTSGFVKPDNIIQTAQFTDFSTVPSRGCCLLVRAKRHGRWWMLKGLKEKYRQDAIYQVLLQKEYEITSQLQHPMVVSVFSSEVKLTCFGQIYGYMFGLSEQNADFWPDSLCMSSLFCSFVFEIL